MKHVTSSPLIACLILILIAATCGAEMRAARKPREELGYVAVDVNAEGDRYCVFAPLLCDSELPAPRVWLESPIAAAYDSLGTVHGGHLRGGADRELGATPPSS